MTGLAGLKGLFALVRGLRCGETGGGGGSPTGPNVVVWYRTDYGLWQDSAVNFEGSHQDALYALASPTLNPSGDFWWAYWLNLKGRPNNAQAVMDKNTGSPFDLYVQSNRYNFRVKTGGTQYTVNADSYGTPPLNTWNFVFAYYDSVNNKANISVNGGDFDWVGTTGLLNQSANSMVYVGRRDDLSLPLSGQIDSLAYGVPSSINNLASTATTIRDLLYNSGRGKIYSDLSDADKSGCYLVSWWDLAEEVGTRFDSYGTNHLYETTTSGLISYTSPVRLNGGFENSGGTEETLDNWLSYIQGTGNVIRDTGVFRTGGASLRLRVDTSNNQVAAYQDIMTTGRRYNLSFWAKTDNTGNNPWAKVGLNYNHADIVLDTAWTNYIVSFFAQEKSFALSSNSSCQGRTIWFDDVKLFPGDVRGCEGLPSGVAQKANFGAQFDAGSQWISANGTDCDFGIGEGNYIYHIYTYLDHKMNSAPDIMCKYFNLFNRNLRLNYDDGVDRFTWSVYNANTFQGKTVTANTFGPVTADRWYSIVVYYSYADDQIGICVNNTGWDVDTVGFFPYNNAQIIVFGQNNFLLNGLPGRIDGFLLGSPSGNVIGAASGMAVSMYNSGFGKKYSDISSDETTEWGLIHATDFDEWGASNSREDPLNSGCDLTVLRYPKQVGGVNSHVGLVSKWTDKTLFNYDLIQPDLSKRPAYTERVYNNHVDTTNFYSVWTNGSGQGMYSKGPILPMSGNMTMSCVLTVPWVHPEGTGCVVEYAGASSQGLILGIRTGSNISQAYVGGGGPVSGIYGGVGLRDGYPHSLIVVRSGNMYSLYVDNAFATQTSGSVPAYSRIFTQKDSNDRNTYMGHVKEIIIYDAALNATQRTTLYDYQKAFFNIP